MQLKGLTEEETMSVFRVVLKGPAKAFVRIAQRDGTLPTTVEGMFMRLWLRFADKSASRKARLELDKLSQTGSVRELILKFQGLVMQLPDLSQEDLVHRFVSMLKGMVRFEVEREIDHPPPAGQSPLEYAFEAAEKAELRTKISQLGVAGPSSSAAPQQQGRFDYRRRQRQNAAMQMSALLRDDHVDLTLEQRDRLRDTRSCYYYCKQENADHILRNCPDKLNGRRPTPMPTGSGASGNGQGRSQQ